MKLDETSNRLFPTVSPSFYDWAGVVGEISIGDYWEHYPESPTLITIAVSISHIPFWSSHLCKYSTEELAERMSNVGGKDTMNMSYFYGAVSLSRLS